MQWSVLAALPHVSGRLLVGIPEHEHNEPTLILLVKIGFVLPRVDFFIARLRLVPRAFHTFRSFSTPRSAERRHLKSPIAFEKAIEYCSLKLLSLARELSAHGRLQHWRTSHLLGRLPERRCASPSISCPETGLVSRQSMPKGILRCPCSAGLRLCFLVSRAFFRLAARRAEAIVMLLRCLFEFAQFALNDISRKGQQPMSLRAN